MTRAQPTDPLDAALRIAAAFEAARISYALGGALAYGIWAIPRATVDVDLNVFAAEDALDAVFAILEELGVVLDRGEARRHNAEQGMFIGRWDLYRIDVFTPSIDFAREAERTRVRLAIGGQQVWVLSAEAIAVFKLLFFRAKDRLDLERLIAVHPALDVSYVRGQIAAMMGDADERVVEWDRVVAESRGSTR